MTENDQGQSEGREEKQPRGDAPPNRPAVRWGIGVCATGVACLAAGYYAGGLIWPRADVKEVPTTASSLTVPADTVTENPGLPEDLLSDLEAPAPATAEELIREVSRVVDYLLRTFPLNTDTLEMKARLHSWLGDSEEAVKIWEQCLELDPNYVHAYVGMASTAAKKGEHQRAADLADKAMQLAPNEFLTRAVLADALIQLGRPAEAIPVLEDFLKADPRSRGYFLLGQAFLQTEQHEQAKASFQAAIRKYPGYAEAYYGLSRACSALGDAERAHQALQTFRELNSPEQTAKRVRGVVVSDFEVMCVDAAVMYTDTGRILYVRNRPREAEILWLRAATLDPENVPCRQSLAFLCRSDGRPQETIAWLTQLAQIEPKNPVYWLEVGRLSEALSQIEAAENAFGKASEAAPQDATSYAALAELLLRNERRLPDARDLAQAAAQRDPSAAHYALLSEACRRNGDRAAALAAIEEALRRAPENAAYRAARDALRSENGRES